MRSRIVPALALCGLLGGCSSTPAVVPAHNLERPGDMGFVCLAVDPNDPNTPLTGRPMRECQPPGAKAPEIQPAGTSSRQRGTFAFVTNTARGEMAVVDLDKGRLVDLDPGVFGFNMVPVGSMPESLSASTDGCWVASANRDSCDLGRVDPSRLLASLLFGKAEPATGIGSPVTTVTPKTKSGRPLNSSPQQIQFLLPSTAPTQCQADQAPLALATFPSCDLVALLDMITGTIEDSVFIRPNGIVSGGSEPQCPVDCIPTSVSDAGAETDDGGTSADAGVVAQGDSDAGVGSPLRVGAMVLRPDRPRVYVGASAADDFLTALDIVDGAFVIPPGGGRIALEPGAIGIDSLRLSVDPFAVPDTAPVGSVIDSQGNFLSQGSFLKAGRGNFLYAFARDGSVRVVNVEVDPEQECDVNVQPSLAKPANTGCFPVNPAARRPLAQGPGIRIPTLPSQNAAPPIARDIAVIDLPPVDATYLTNNPPALSGQFAFLLTSNDSVYILNLAPLTLVNGQAPVVDEANTLTHSFREIRSTGQYTADILALSFTPPLRTPLPSDLLFPTTPILSSLGGPRLEEVANDSTLPVAATKTSVNLSPNYWVDSPYPATYVSRTFSVAWEAALPGTTRSSGTLQSPAQAGSSAGALKDVGADFCDKNVLAGDLVVLPGCTADTDCVPQDSFTCHQPIGGAVGLCLSKTAPQGLVENCTRFMGSRRRYEVVGAGPTQLTLGLHLDEVPKTVLNRVAATATGDDTECQPTSEHQGFQWQQVWPNENFKRCVKACGRSPAVGATSQDLDQDCRPGFVCEAVPGSVGPRLLGEAGARYCVEAPPLDLVCWPQPGNRYHVNVGNGFLVSGSSLPDLKTTTVVDGQCQLDPNRDPALANRIPLSASACASIDGVVPIDNVTLYSTNSIGAANTEVALFGQLAPPVPGTAATPNPPYTPVTPPGPNPCLYQDFSYDDPTSIVSVPDAETADGGAGNGASKKPIKAIFQNPQIRLVMTNLDQYGGDSLTTSMTLIGGFVPATVAVPSYDIALTQPIRIYTGPTQLPDSPVVTNPTTSTISYPYLYVLDQGRTALTPGSRGQIVRINARKGDTAVTTFDPSASGTTPFQIQ
ncbi:MAG: hypothetical protein WCG85_18865 [Polyangia bacterium]